MECSRLLRHLKIALMIRPKDFPKIPYSKCSSFFPIHSKPVLAHFMKCSPVITQTCSYAKGGKEKGKKQKLMKLSEEEMSNVIDVEDFKLQLHQVQEKLKKDFFENLSLRSSAHNLNNVIVKFEEEEYPLHELARISKKNQNLIAINMIDFPEAIKPAIKAITESGSAMNPQQEGTMIYLSIPKLTREHRENLVKSAKSLVTAAKIEIREIQNSFIKDAKKQTDLSEDLVFSTTNQIMAMAEVSAAELEKILKSKQKELLGED